MGDQWHSSVDVDAEVLKNWKIPGAETKKNSIKKQKGPPIPLPLQLVGPESLVGRGDRHRRHNLRVGVVRVEGERVAAADVQRDQLPGGNALEHGHHVVVGEAQHAGAVHVHQHVAWKNERRMLLLELRDNILLSSLNFK